MKKLLIGIRATLYSVIGVSWIVSGAGEDCQPVPIYRVVCERGRVFARTVRVIHE